MKLAVEDLDQDALEALSMHFILMKIALTGLRVCGRLFPRRFHGETPVKIASALADLADHFGFNNTPEHLRSMFERAMLLWFAYLLLRAILEKLDGVPQVVAS